MFAAYEIRDLYLRLTEELSHGKVELLPEIHALSSGLKSVVSWETAQVLSFFNLIYSFNFRASNSAVWHVEDTVTHRLLVSQRFTVTPLEGAPTRERTSSCFYRWHVL